jgi:methionine synthase I (cobalamin-dependent)/5,10-methylenetetrahydrofolate reductase
LTSFLDALGDRVLVCDGAMGTLLYAQGIFINRCFDALNLTDPARVSSVHDDYVRAGADVIETNTFGANRVKLRAFGLADQMADINRAGAQLARKAAGRNVYVAGAMGPLGLRIEPWGKTAFGEAVAYFKEQAQALISGGVDLLMLETFRDVNEIVAAIAAVKSISTLPIVAQMTIEDEGNSLDGTPPEQFVPALQAAGADVIGINCSIGPAHMLEALERMAGLTPARLSAQPNAGRPRDIEGRTLYLTSPEYMASYARRFTAAHVRLIGGCCGTTPEHISQIKAAITTGAKVTASSRPSAPAPAAPAVTPIAREEKSFLAHALSRGRWVTMVEIVPPRGHASDITIEHARRLRVNGVDAVLVPDGQTGPRLSALSLAVLIHQRTGIETVLQCSARDRGLLDLQSDLLGAHAMGIRNIVLVTGDVPLVGDYSDATAVVDVDSIGLLNAVSRFNHGTDVGGQAIGAPTAFHVGVTVNPGAEDLDREIRRFEYKLDAGAEFIVTRPVFDVRSFDRVAARLEAAKLPVLLGVRPLDSVLDADFMANEMPGSPIPEGALERMRRAHTPESAAKEGIAVAREVYAALKTRVQGVLVTASPGGIDRALDVLQTAGV